MADGKTNLSLKVSKKIIWLQLLLLIYKCYRKILKTLVVEFIRT